MWSGYPHRLSTGSGGFSSRKKSHASFEQPVEEQRLVKLGRLRSAASKDSIPNSHASKPGPQLDDAAKAEAGVLRTTHLSTPQTYVTGNSEENRKRQHPWIEESQGV
ncbi:hypothetical protein GGS24DRAFT_271123 [Hypoxylon argillaceum]|nr:hypothetical protein GGS24DRAFT_271123 [Hypoxylon argillaceum]